MISSILLASIVWVFFLVSNIAVGFVMYRLGLNGRIKNYTEKFDEDEAVNRIANSLGGGHIPGSEFNPFETQPLPRYKYFSMDEDDQEREMDDDVNYGFAPDPVVPMGGDELNGEGKRKTGQPD